MRYAGCLQSVSDTRTAQVELKSGRVEAPGFNSHRLTIYRKISAGLPVTSMTRVLNPRPLNYVEFL